MLSVDRAGAPTTESLYLRPKNWWRYQHYQDGRPLTWIKNHLELDEPGSKFAALSYADQGRLQKLWRLAARQPNGLIPYDEQYLRSHLGDKRFTFGSHLLSTWFAVGTQMELKKAAQKEKRSRRSPQTSSPKSREQRVKKDPAVRARVESPAVNGFGTFAGLPIASEKGFELERILRLCRDADGGSLRMLELASSTLTLGGVARVRESCEKRRGRIGVGYAVNALRSEADAA